MKYATETNLLKLKIKAMSLAEEARIIRKQERRELAKSKAFRESSGITGFTRESYRVLREHRISDVRFEARATHLARAFLAGKSYSSTEKNVKNDFWQYAALRRASEIAFKYMERSWNSRDDYPYARYIALIEEWRTENAQKILTGISIQEKEQNRRTAEKQIQTRILLEWAGKG